jgi:hypothetical protein
LLAAEIGPPRIKVAHVTDPRDGAAISPTLATAAASAEDVCVKRAAWIGLAGLAAAAGVVWYAIAPGVGSFQASGLLTAPALVMVLVWLHRRLPLKLQWALAIGIAAIGPIGYLTFDGSQWWNWGQLTPFPLLLLAVSRPGWESSQDALSDEMAGPFGPP